MRGLRGLCCSSADVNDPDNQSPANRPVQQVPQKESQNAANAPTSPNKGSSTDATQANSNPKPKEECEEKPDEKPDEKPVEKPVEKPEEEPKEKPPPSDLWKEAYDGLSRSGQDYLPANEKPATDAIQDVIDVTTAKYELFEKGGLRIHRKEKDDINIRDASMKILGAAMKAKDIISNAVSFDPTGHASSAWTVISFGMSIVQNRLDRRDAIFQSSAYLTENLSWFAIVDTHYRNQGVDSDKNVDEALLRAYSAILEFTAEVRKSEKENQATRTWKSIFPLTDQALSTLKTTVGEQKAAADQWIRLAANLGDRERAKEHLDKTEAGLESTRRLVDKAKTEEEEQQAKWMSEFDFSGRQHFLHGKRTGDTGTWLLDSQEYTHWMVTPGDLLWLPGITGCGKSVLCSTVIHDLSEICKLDPYKYLAYWYFHFGDDLTKSVYTMARSLIRQLCRSPMPSSLVKIWDEHHIQGGQPDLKSILGVLDDVLSASIPDRGHVYLVFDALDECPDNTHADSKRKSLLSILVNLLQLHKDKVHILATSRPEHDIKAELERFSKVDLEFHLAEDVKEFVTAAISGPSLEKYNEEIKGLIFDTLTSSKERRFRWAELQIQMLENRRKRRTGEEDAIKEALKKIPKDLEDTYRRILDSIEPEDLPLARDILMLISLSPDTLDVNTAAEMTNLDSSDDVVNICTTSLVTVSKDRIQMAHFSVQEFLIVSEKNDLHHECQFSVADGHKSLLTAAVDYLLEQTEELTTAEVRERHFFLYAAMYWNTHATALGGFDQLDPTLKSKITRLFTEPTVYLNWVRPATDTEYIFDEWWSTLETHELPISRASRMGFYQVVEKFLDQGTDPDATNDGNWGSPLQAASKGGHEKIAQLLLNRGANFNSPQGNDGTPLQSASFERHEMLVQILLNQGADVTVPGGDHGDALQAASLGGNEKIVQMLLDRRADVNSPAGRCGTALQAAASAGNERIVQMLLEKHADVNSLAGPCGTALQAAALAGNERIVQMLLEKHADVDPTGKTYGSPLQAASYKGHERIVRILLDRHADVNAPDGDFGSPLQTASFGGNEKVVEMLLNEGADVNAEGPLGTALLAAVANGAGNEKVVEMLLGRSVDINARGGKREATPLQYAAREGYEKIVELLLKRGADPNILEGKCGSALQGAMFGGKEKIVQMLLDAGADVNATGGRYGSPVEAAVRAEDEAMLQMLLDGGADTSAPGYQRALRDAQEYPGWGRNDMAYILEKRLYLAKESFMEKEILE